MGITYKSMCDFEETAAQKALPQHTLEHSPKLSAAGAGLHETGQSEWLESQVGFDASLLLLVNATGLIF